MSPGNLSAHRLPFVGSPPRLHPLLAATPHQWEGGTEKHFLEAGTPCRSQIVHFFFSLWLGQLHLRAERPEKGHGSGRGLGGRKGGSWVPVMQQEWTWTLGKKRGRPRVGRLWREVPILCERTIVIMWVNMYFFGRNILWVLTFMYLWLHSMIYSWWPNFSNLSSFFCASFPSPYPSTRSPFCLLSSPFISVTVDSFC